MKTVFAFFAALALAAAIERPAQAASTVSVDFFYDALAPFGDWVEVEGYGYCFRPAVTLNDPEWRPYTEGSWIYTDAGWTWESDEDFGWATYHYGRWTKIEDQWLWIPGDVWGPAWVSWRADDEYVGWAPLPPEAVWTPDTGFTEYVDVSYDIGPAYYSFIPVHYLGERHLRRWVEPWRRNVDYMRRTHNYTRIIHRQTDNYITSIFNEGPDFTRFARSTDQPIRRMTLATRTDTDFRDPNTRFRNTAENDSFRVIAPTVSLAAAATRDGNRGPAPAKVKQHFDRAKVNHGWNGFRQEEVNALRSEIKTNSVDTTRERSGDVNRATVTGDQPARTTDTHRSESTSSDRVTSERNAARPGEKDEVRKALPAGSGQNRPDERTAINPDGNQKRKIEPLDPNREAAKGPDRFRGSPQDAPPRSEVGPRSSIRSDDNNPPGPSRKALPGEDSGNTQRPDRADNPRMKTDREKGDENSVPRAVRPDDNTPPSPSRKLAPGQDGSSQRPDRIDNPKMKTEREKGNDNAVPRGGVTRPDDNPPGPSRKVSPAEESGNSKRPDRLENPKMKTEREKGTDNPAPRAGITRPDDNPPGAPRNITPGKPTPSGNSQRPDGESVPRVKPQKQDDPTPRVPPQQRVQPAPEARKIEPPKHEPRLEQPKSNPPPALQKSDNAPNPEGKPGASKNTDDDEKKKKHP